MAIETVRNFSSACKAAEADHGGLRLRASMPKGLPCRQRRPQASPPPASHASSPRSALKASSTT